MPHLKIIVGGDFNFFAKQTYDELTERNADKINIYPTDSKEVTTKKQRSWLQPQIAKSEVEDTVCRDFLLSSHKMYQTKLSTYSSGLIKSASEKLPS